MSEPLAIHDIRDAHKFSRRILNLALERHKISLHPDRHVEALAYLVALTWELGQRYDHTLNTSFSNYAWNMLQLRFIDWLRDDVQDTRYSNREPDLSLDEAWAELKRLEVEDAPSLTANLAELNHDDARIALCAYIGGGDLEAARLAGINRRTFRTRRMKLAATKYERNPNDPPRPKTRARD